MTGPQHYEEAERLLEVAALNRGTVIAEAAIPAAQIHATLAAAAATALTAGDRYQAMQADMTEWRMAAGNPLPGEDAHERIGGQP